MRLAFIVSHPIQYYVPIYRELAKRARRQGTVIRGQGAGDGRRETGDRGQGSGDRGQETGDGRQVTGDRPRTTIYE